ncbi:hypothetical protein PGT21_032574 [Puccinia graminis f. sp. tritici]|uniref:Uncharacterized protein n=1 Tax=Puccinia graminis f. sp. tritici TaxID=56615 RepID=A0A5B0R296_PUCGR|nr:hypothetical protein PGT21_032574 [Puccinia graminis f. sp. tritici]
MNVLAITYKFHITTQVINCSSTFIADHHQSASTEHQMVMTDSVINGDDWLVINGDDRLFTNGVNWSIIDGVNWSIIDGVNWSIIDEDDPSFIDDPAGLLWGTLRHDPTRPKKAAWVRTALPSGPGLGHLKRSIWSDLRFSSPERKGDLPLLQPPNLASTMWWSSPTSNRLG